MGTIVTDFKDTEVRHKSPANLPKFFRHWESVKKNTPLYLPDWPKQIRRPNRSGYPPFDIYSHWLMDFATITTAQLGESNWRQFRNMALVHVPNCNLYCGYCFNDAFIENNVETGNKSGKEIVKEFLNFRQYYQALPDDEYNILRISGGEPFMQPDLIKDIATELYNELNEKKENSEPQYKDPNKVFLWVDTNMVAFMKDSLNGDLKDALNAIAALENRAAIHACLHGSGKESFRRNTCREDVDRDMIENALKNLFNTNIKKNIYVYPRINPLGLNPSEVKEIFYLLFDVVPDRNLPLKTYLGIIELLYAHSIDRMRCFQDLNPFFNKADKVRKLPDIYKKQENPPLFFNPPNAVIYTWNRLLEYHYGTGYSKIPRYVDISINKYYPIRDRYQTETESELENSENVEWCNFILHSKGWEKENYALKTLELLSMPKGAIFEVELENRWVEPTFLAHAFTSPKFYENKCKVLLAAAYKDNVPVIIPLRWGKIKNLVTADCLNKRCSLNLKIELEDYADDFSQTFICTEDTTVFEYLARYTGINRLPYGSNNGYFSQYIGIEQRIKSTKDNSIRKDAAFNYVITAIQERSYDKAKSDIYFRIKSIQRMNGDDQMKTEINLQDGELIVEEGYDIEIKIEACNPNIDNPGYPKTSQAELSILSTINDKIEISPAKVTLSKYGEEHIRIRFNRSGTYQGELLFQPVSQEARMASFRIPFKVKLEDNI